MAGLLARRRRAGARGMSRRARALHRPHFDLARKRRTRACGRRRARSHPHARAACSRRPPSRRRARAAHPELVPRSAVSAFEVNARDGAARAGVLRTAHGKVRTPAFMPVGTKATVKTVDPVELQELGAEIVLGNAYHLHFRPGEELIAELGGLHTFMGWDGAILTDSGGFQVFSLRDTLLEVDDDGVTFRSVYDGAPERFTPELAARVQELLGSDITMCLDICSPADASRAELEEAVRRTTLWAERQRDLPRAPGQLRFAITQGGLDDELRSRSSEEDVALAFAGYAIGGITAVGHRATVC